MTLTKTNHNGLRVPSPDGKRYLISKEDANGIAQVYLGTYSSTADPICLTNKGGWWVPSVNKFKMQPTWHPGGKYIVMAVEREWYNTGLLWLLGRDAVEGVLQCGIWVDMWALRLSDGKWTKLIDFAGLPDGYTGVAFTPDGKKGVWSQAMGDVLTHKPFGKWELTMGEWVEDTKGPRWINKKNITPALMSWNEPGNFHLDGETLLITGSLNSEDQQGMDQYTLNIKTAEVRNLTNSPSECWDEHGIFSPDGKKIIFISNYPYQSDPTTGTIGGFKTEFMMMNRDGSGLTQLTRFRDPSAPEYHNGAAAVGLFQPNGSISLLTLEFPNYHSWELTGWNQ